MKNTLKWLFALAVLCGTTQLRAQELTLRNIGDRATFEQIFTEIERQTDIWIAYISEDFDSHAMVAVPQGARSLRTILNEIFSGTGYKYSIDGKYVFVIRQSEPMPARASYVLPPNRLRSSINPDAKAPLRDDQRRRLVTEGVDSTYQVLAFNGKNDAFNFDGQQIIARAPQHHSFPVWAIKTNLLYGGATLTPNLALEFGLGRRTSLEISASYHPWKRENEDIHNKKFVHSIYRPEFRWWLCERFNGHFLGVHAFYANYNINGYKVPLLFKKEYRNEGWAVGAGFTYGYHWAWAKHWGMEFNIGVGVAYLDYKRYDCIRCSRDGEPKTKTYIGPTRLGISLVYIFK